MQDLLILAKEKGFSSNLNNDSEYYLKLCELQKWLREKCNCIVEVFYIKKEADSNVLTFVSTVDYYQEDFKFDVTEDADYVSPEFDLYETALENGLYNSLLLIKN